MTSHFGLVATHSSCTIARSVAMSPILAIIIGTGALIGIGAHASATPPVAITEWMYQGSSPGGGEFVEFTNLSDHPVDLTGWSFDDDHRVPGAFDLSGFGVVAPGESVILTEDHPEAFRVVWGLAPTVKVVGELGVRIGNNLGRNDEINLYDADGTLVDRLTYGDQAFPGSVRTRWFSGIPNGPEALGANDPYPWSLAADGDAAGSWTSTFGDVGNPGVFAGFVAPQPDPPVFSAPGGFHTAAFDLTLAAEPDVAIHYTLDGSTPTAASPQYAGPITVTPLFGVPDHFALIPSSPPEGWEVPAISSFKATIVRAVAIRPNAEPSPVVTRTYFVDPLIQTRWTLPLVSIVTDEASLFGYEPGIYVPGKIYDDNFDPSIAWWARPANYRERGDAWERRANFEFFEHDGVAGGIPTLNHEIGVRIHGGATRALRRKSLRLYARSEYGQSTFEHRMFPDLPDASFKRLLLRNGGNDWNLTLFRDAMMQRLVRDLGIDTQAYRPTIVFINGEYWGVHNLRERYDHHYILRNHGWERDEIDLLTGFAEVEEGDAMHWLETHAYAIDNDLSDPAHFAEIESRVDIDDHITYFAAQIYFRNTDWPQNNIDYWRPRTPDGRWRWLLYDTDFGFGLWGQPQAWAFNSLDWVNTIQHPNGRFFQRLLLNESYRNRFVNRYADMMNTVFVAASVVETIDQMQAVLAPNMQEHVLRWRDPVSVSSWNSRVNVMRTFANNRPAAARDHVVEVFDLPGMSTLTFANPTPERGTLRVNTVDLADRPLPWSGVYFDTIPLPIHATSAAGFRFAGFLESAPTAGMPVVVTPSGDATLTARFVRIEDLNGDGIVDGADLGLLLDAWGSCDACPADLDGDGVVDGADLGMLLSAWGR